MRVSEAITTVPGVSAAALLLCVFAGSCGEVEEVRPVAGALTVELPPEPRPEFERIVLVTIDTLRADHLGCYGYFRETSPFLDRLAERSVRFERAMATSSHTAPSHASMFTGLPPGLHGLFTNGSRLSTEVPTIAGVLGRAGFETAAFASVEFLEGVSTGFDHVRAQTSAAKAISRAAITWVRKKRTSDRFFLWMHFYEPHRWKMTERAPREHLDAVRSATQGDAYAEVARLHGLPDPGPGEPLGTLAWRSGDKGGEEIHPSSRAEVMAFVDSYDAQIAYADAEIERAYEAIEGLGLEGSSLWIVTSDHGEGLGSHDYAGHGWQIYNEQLRVPLILHASDDSLGPLVVEDLVSHVDLLPTVADSLGGELGGGFASWSGISLLPLMRGERAAPDRTVFAQRRPPRVSGATVHFALQTRRHKYIMRSADDQFFDLESDPLELVDRAAEGGAEMEALRTALEAHVRTFAEHGLEAQEGNEAWAEELRKLGYAE
jgi:arylsulfatase A-like enzyme